MSLPAPAPGRRARTDLRTVIIAVIVGALTLSGVVVGGRLAARGVNYAQPPVTEEETEEGNALSDLWADGASQQWSTTIGTEASVFTTPDRLFSVTTGDDPQASTLTSYAMDASGVSQAWTATVDTSADSVAEGTADNNPTSYPSFLLWGKNTLIHGRTLYDITTGATSDAPWPADAVPVVVKDTDKDANEGMVIACQQSTCAGYHEGSTEPAWSSIVHDAVSGIPTQTLDAAAHLTQLTAYSYTGAISMAGSRYAAIATQYVINIDTGEVLSFSVPNDPPGVYSIGYADENWIIISNHYNVIKRAPEQAYLSFYNPSGGEPISTETAIIPSSDTHPLSYPRASAKEDYRNVWVRDDYSTLAGSTTTTELDKRSCVQKIDMSNGTTIDVSALDKSTFPCFDNEATTVSENAAVVTVGMKQVTNATPFSLMYNAETGQQIEFEGMDPNNRATFTTVSPTQVIGYSPADGTLTSYTPSSAR